MFRTLKSIVVENIGYLYSTSSLAVVERNKAYRNTNMGWFWAIFKPLFYIMMFYFAITIGFRSASNIPGIVCPYFIWLTAGMLPWFYMQNKIMGGANCFRSHKTLIVKIKFPLSCIPTIVCFSDILIHFIMLEICFIICLFSGVYPSVYWLQLPFYFLLMFLLSYIWALGSGLLATVSVDFLNLLKCINPAFFWLSGILFNIRPMDRFQLLFKLNPISYIVEGYRNSIAYHIWFWEDLSSLLFFLFDILLMLFVSLLLYRRLGKRIPNYI